MPPAEDGLPGPRSSSDDLEVPVHVADALHWASEALEESGRARNEALPPEKALLMRAERKRDRVVSRTQRTRSVGAGILRVIGNPLQRDRDAELGNREHVRGGRGVDSLGRLPV